MRSEKSPDSGRETEVEISRVVLALGPHTGHLKWL